ncbi:MAG TPA: DMT family transporter [Roseiflexaceae bacterium]|nr:DMT family transporter [Roseiflexaceae bacterium]
MLVAIAVAFLSGVARTVGRMANAQLAGRVGALQSTCYNYLVGLICSALILALDRRPAPAAAFDAGAIPAWAYLGGAVGVVFVVLSNHTTPKLPAFSMTLLMFVGQLATGVAIDLLAHQQPALGKIVGGGLILAGLLVDLSIDRGRRRSLARSAVSR